MSTEPIPTISTEQAQRHDVNPAGAPAPGPAPVWLQVHVGNETYDLATQGLINDLPDDAIQAIAGATVKLLTRLRDEAE